MVGKTIVGVVRDRAEVVGVVWGVKMSSIGGEGVTGAGAGTVVEGDAFTVVSVESAAGAAVVAVVPPEGEPDPDPDVPDPDVPDPLPDDDATDGTGETALPPRAGAVGGGVSSGALALLM
jgi:hypothetical protein